MNISEASKKSQVSAKMIRRYEEQGIIPAVTRSDSGYRQYSETDIHTLKFVKRSRELGFSTKDTKKLVSLWQNKQRSSSEVKKIALEHIEKLEEKLYEVQSMLDTLKHLASNCHGDQRPDCPILNELNSK